MLDDQVAPLQAAAAKLESEVAAIHGPHFTCVPTPPIPFSSVCSGSLLHVPNILPFFPFPSGIVARTAPSYVTAPSSLEGTFLLTRFAAAGVSTAASILSTRPSKS